MDAIDVTGAAGVDAALVSMEVRTLLLVVDCTEPPTTDPGVDDCRGVRSLCCPPVSLAAATPGVTPNKVWQVWSPIVIVYNLMCPLNLNPLSLNQGYIKVRVSL